MLASVARQAPAAGATTVVVTSDRDAFGLIDAHTRVLRIINGGVEASPLLTAERLVTLLGVRPEQYRDFAALRGDPSDNLPGVRGIGPKTAARLLTAFGDARTAFDDLAAVAEAVGPGVAARLAAPGARATWELNCQVMAMREDVAVDLSGTGRGAAPAARGGQGRVRAAGAAVDGGHRASRAGGRPVGRGPARAGRAGLEPATPARPVLATAAEAPGRRPARAVLSSRPIGSPAPREGRPPSAQVPPRVRGRAAVVSAGGPARLRPVGAGTRRSQGGSCSPGGDGACRMSSLVPSRARMSHTAAAGRARSTAMTGAIRRRATTSRSSARSGTRSSPRR